MTVTLVINGQSVDAAPGSSLFDYAEGLGIQVPTSCRKQGKCKECLVEVTAGTELLTPLTPEEEHLKGSFRLSCRCQVLAGHGRSPLPHAPPRSDANRATRARPAARPTDRRSIRP